jgi:hypothetical protein
VESHHQTIKATTPV